MPDKFKIEGATTRCEICGNYYSLDYIVFHQQERCPKTIKDIQNIPSSNTTEPLTSSIIEISKKEIQQKPKPVAQPSLQPQKGKIICPYCKVGMKQEKYESHITKKCPTLRQKKKEKSLTTSIRKGTKNGLWVKPLKKRTLPHIESKNNFISVITNKVRCSQCHYIYAKTEAGCPECLRIKLRNQTLIVCHQCNVSFDEENYNKHLLKCGDSEICCLICKQVLSTDNFQRHFHSWKQKESISLNERTLCDFCKGPVKPENLEKHFNKSCPQVRVECEICNMELLRGERANHLRLIHKIDNSSNKIRSVKSGVFIKTLSLKKNRKHKRCGICGRIAMYNSGHCYSCGDK